MIGVNFLSINAKINLAAMSFGQRKMKKFKKSPKKRGFGFGCLGVFGKKSLVGEAIFLKKIANRIILALNAFFYPVNKKRFKNQKHFFWTYWVKGKWLKVPPVIMAFVINF